MDKLEEKMDVAITMQDANKLAELAEKRLTDEVKTALKPSRPLLTSIAFAALNNKRRVSGKAISDLVVELSNGVGLDELKGEVKNFSKYYKSISKIDTTPLNKTKEHVASYVEHRNERSNALQEASKKREAALKEKEERLQTLSPEEKKYRELNAIVNKKAKEVIERVKGKVSPQDMGKVSAFIHKNPDMSIDEVESEFRKTNFGKKREKQEVSVDI